MWRRVFGEMAPIRIGAQLLVRFVATTVALVALAHLAPAQSPPPALGPRVEALRTLPPPPGASAAQPLRDRTAVERAGAMVTVQQGHPFVGLVIGAAVGAGAGALVGGNSWTPCSGPLFSCLFHPSTREAAAGLGAAIGATAGGLLGWAIGASITSEVRVAGRSAGARLVVAPGAAGVKVEF